MSYLLDTHTLLWLMFKDEALSDKVRSIIEDEESLFVSIASFWEIAIKQNLEKLEFTQSVVDIANECLRQGRRDFGHAVSLCISSFRGIKTSPSYLMWMCCTCFPLQSRSV